MKVFVNQSTKTLRLEERDSWHEKDQTPFAAFQILILPLGLQYCTGGRKTIR
jgi:hypothetical protein